MKSFTVGSNVFFKDIEGFTPHDMDILLLIEEPNGFNIHRQIHIKDKCIFQWKHMSADEFVEYHKNCKCGMFIGKFLVPEFVKEIGFTIEHLKQLQFLIDLLDEKHTYEKIIYNSYMENNGFYMTNELLLNAYKIYKNKQNIKR